MIAWVFFLNELIKIMRMPIDFIAADIIFRCIHVAATQYFVSLFSSASLLSIPTKANKISKIHVQFLRLQTSQEMQKSDVAVIVIFYFICVMLLH